MNSYSLKFIWLLVFYLSWAIYAEAQNFPDLNFSVPESYKFEINSISQTSSGYVSTELLSKSRYVEGKNSIYIGHIDMNNDSLSPNEFLNSRKIEYGRQGMRSTIQEMGNKRYIITGRELEREELGGSYRYLMFATTIHNGDAYSIVAISTVSDQMDWILRIAEEIEYH